MIIAQTTILKRREKLPGFEESELLRGLFSIQFHLIRLNWLLETRVLGRIVSTAIDPERLLGFLQDSKVISRIVVSNLIFWYRTGFWESSTVSLSLSLSLSSIPFSYRRREEGFKDSFGILQGLLCDARGWRNLPGEGHSMKGTWNTQHNNVLIVSELFTHLRFSYLVSIRRGIGSIISWHVSLFQLLWLAARPKI